MSTDINGIGPRTKGASTGVGLQPPERETAAAGRQVSAGDGDKLSLTEAARQLNELAAEVQGASEVDAARVERLRAAVQNGTYTADPDRIAVRLLQQEAGLPDV